MESQVNVQANVIHKLKTECDSLQQYGRRSSVRVYGLELKENESEVMLGNEIEKCYKHSNITYDKNEIDRYHRIGPVYEQNGKKMQSVIIKFKSWEARQKFYKGRPRRFVRGKKKPGAVKYTVSLDLTRRRYLLFQKAKERSKSNNNVNFVFVNDNCALAIRFNDDKIQYFNTESELMRLLPNGSE